MKTFTAHGGGFPIICAKGASAFCRLILGAMLSPVFPEMADRMSAWGGTKWQNIEIEYRNGEDAAVGYFTTVRGRCEGVAVARRANCGVCETCGLGFESHRHHL